MPETPLTSASAGTVSNDAGHLFFLGGGFGFTLPPNNLLFEGYVYVYIYIYIHTYDGSEILNAVLFRRSECKVCFSSLISRTQENNSKHGLILQPRIARAIGAWSKSTTGSVV